MKTKTKFLAQGQDPETPSMEVVTDANVLINLALIEQLQLLGKLEGLEFVVLEEVLAEVSRPNQRQALGQAIDRSDIRRDTVAGIEELTAFARHRDIMGRGEAACLAVAELRNWCLASDERGRFLRHAKERLGQTRLFNTPGILCRAIHSGLLALEKADKLKEVLEQNRFRMRFRSFRDVLGDT